MTKKIGNRYFTFEDSSAKTSMGAEFCMDIYEGLGGRRHPEPLETLRFDWSYLAELIECGKPEPREPWEIGNREYFEKAVEMSCDYVAENVM